MSSATPSHRTPSVPDDKSTAAAWIDRFTSGIRATAFWTATVLPLLLVAVVVAGPVGQYPGAFAVAVALNLLCAVVGHDHAPGR